MYPVVISDLDGTLLTKQHEISPRTREVIHALSERGIKFVFATGRHYQDVEKIRAQLGVDMYLITSNGARVHDPAGNRIIEHNIKPELVQKLLSLRKLFADCVHTSVYKGEQWLVEFEHPELNNFSQASGFNYQLTDFDLLPVPTPDIQKVFFAAKSHEDLLPLSEQAKTRFGEQLSMAFSLPVCFEVMAEGVNKGLALGEVLQLEGYDFDHAIAFGDGMNDLEMLSSVGKGLVMGNADPKLLNRLPGHERIGHCDQHAVAEYLAQLYDL